MRKHIKAEIKYNYVMRYLRGETLSSIAKEMILNGHTTTKNTKHAKDRLLDWKRKYQRLGFEGLESKTGLSATGRPPKKKKPDYSNWTKEELIEHIETFEEWIEKFGNSKRSLFMFIKMHKNISVRKLCNVLEVSRSGYYKWLKEGEKIIGNYDTELLEKIKFLFDNVKARYGYRRITILLEKEFGIKKNKETIRRYMSFLGLKAKIRQPKRPTERKITNKDFEDLIKRNWNTNTKHEKLFTDVTYIKTTNGWCYLSVVLDSFNNEIISHKFSRRNDVDLVYDSFKIAMRKIDDYENVIIHSDHGLHYFSKDIEVLRNKLGFKQSMGRVGVSLDNRPVEYFFSILKQEYLFEGAKDFDATKKLIDKSISHYNNIRFQGCLNNLSPVAFLKILN